MNFWGREKRPQNQFGGRNDDLHIERCFCTRNCSCSGMIFGGNQAQYDEARKEAKKAGLERYTVVSGACGDWYIVERDEMGRLV